MAKPRAAKKPDVTVALDGATEDAVRSWGEQRPGLCVIEVDAGLEDAVGTAYTLGALSTAAARASDARVAEPESGGWRVEEIDELIIEPSNHAPLVCNVIVVKTADSMSQLGRDRLLKTLEEPGGRTSFCFLVRSRAALGATILGRASRIEVIGDEGALAALRAVFGEGNERYEAAWRGSLGRVAVGSVDLLRSASAWDDPAPMARAAHIATFFEGTDTGSRRIGRALAGAWLTSVARDVGAALVAGAITADRAEHVLGALAAARENLIYNSPIGLVTARALI